MDNEEQEKAMFAPVHPDTMMGLVRQHEAELIGQAERRRRSPRRHRPVHRRT